MHNFIFIWSIFRLNNHIEIFNNIVKKWPYFKNFGSIFLIREISKVKKYKKMKIIMTKTLDVQKLSWKIGQ